MNIKRILLSILIALLGLIGPGSISQPASPPFIFGLALSRADTADRAHIWTITYQDLDADAAYIDYTLLKTNAPGIVIGDSTMPPDPSQTVSAQTYGVYNCVPGYSYFVLLKVEIVDARGQRSNAVEFKILCP